MTRHLRDLRLIALLAVIVVFALVAVFVVLGAALLYLVIPGILSGFLGDGCVTR